MKIRICTINKNEGEGRQEIFWDTEDKLLKSNVSEEAETEYKCETIQEAAETANALWNWSGSNWGFEWDEELEF